MPLILVILLALIVYASSLLLLNNRFKAGIFASFFLLLFFIYGPFFNSAELILHYSSLTYRAAPYFCLGLYVLMILLAFPTLKRTAKNLENLNKILNFSVFVLLMFVLVNLTASIIKDAALEESIVEDISPQEKELEYSGNLPDIYYIILDGYAGALVLDELYDLDNSKFLSDLRMRGFFVGERSKANYNQTYLSLTSSLNMEYLHYLKGRTAGNKKSVKILQSIIDNSKVFNNLRPLGYKIINYSSGFGLTAGISSADRNIGFKKRPNQLAKLLKRRTLIKALNLKEEHFKVEAIPTTFRLLRDNADKERPKFVLAHILSPHPPFVFQPDGKILSDHSDRLDDWEDPSKYFGEILYLNKKTIELVDFLRSNSTVDPVILIQADHGSMFHRGGQPNYNIERSYILNAYFLPKRCRKSLYETISPVKDDR